MERYSPFNNQQERPPTHVVDDIVRSVKRNRLTANTRNKYHRFNHHSFQSPEVPDAGHDPIASYASPFRGEFILSGMLSAVSPLTADNYSIITDSTYSSFISAESIIVTNDIRAHYMNVDIIEVTVYAVTGLYLSGSGSQSDYIHIPTIPWDYDVLTLDHIGLSSNSWAVFGGDVLIRNGLTADNISLTGDIIIGGDIQCDNIIANSAFIDDIAFDDAYGDYLNVDTIYATNYENLPAPTSNNIIINYNQGWESPTIDQWVPGSWQVYDTLSAAVSTDRMVTISIRADEYQSYGEIYAVVDGNIVARSKVGNFGLITNSNIDHALSAGLWIDASQPATFMVPACSVWWLSAGKVYSNYINVDVVEYIEKRAWIEVTGGLLSVNTISTQNVYTDLLLAVSGNINFINTQNIYTNTLTATDSVTLSTLNFTGTAINISSNVYVSAFTNPVTADGWLVFNISGTQKAVRLYDVTT